MKVPDSGSGRMIPVVVPGPDTTSSDRVVTYALEIEDGLGIDRAAVAKKVGQTLRDPRGWQTQDDVRFVQVTPKQLKSGTKPQVTISLVSPDRTDQMCAPLQTEGTWSCANKDHAVLNFRRWALGASGYGPNLDGYRAYQINHEVGHELGHPHEKCPRPQAPAPVMVQQSMGLEGCLPNPHPTVAG